MQQLNGEQPDKCDDDCIKEGLAAAAAAEAEAEEAAEAGNACTIALHVSVSRVMKRTDRQTIIQQVEGMTRLLNRLNNGH